MKNSLALLLLASACCLIYLQPAKADVTSYTNISYYEPTNSIYALGEVLTDYDTLAYYCMETSFLVAKNEEQLDWVGDGSCENNWNLYEGFFAYDPAADYSIEALPQLISKHNYPIGDGYEDYYNYVQWSLGDPVYYPTAFGFTGPGPSTEIDFASIVLGSVYSYFTEGATAGPPDHLKVISDTGQAEQQCGTIRRRIVFQVVDSTGRRAGSRNTRERFYNPSSNIEMANVSNSCRNDTISPSGCSLDVGGRFTDQLWAGCPTVSGFCGTDQFISKWIWCPRGKPEQVLTSNTYHVRNTFVHVNGGGQFGPGTQLYP
jgi:hypothetical protein